MHHTFVSRVLILWLPILVAISGLFLFAYWGLQQNYRVSLNDPQIQMAEDGSTKLATGETPTSLVSGLSLVDIAASLAPWMVVYSASGTPLAASGELDGAPAQLPLGVFSTNTWHIYAEYGIPLRVPIDEDRFSWQPRADVRQAVVLVHYDSASGGGFVAAGRNMREVENRIQTLTDGAIILWSASALGSLLVIVALTFIT